MDVLSQVACNIGYSLRVNHKVSTTAAASNKQGDVELVNIGLDGSNNLIFDVIYCEHISNSTVNYRHLNCKMQTNDYLQERAQVKTRRYPSDYAAVVTAFAAIVLVSGQIRPEFIRLLWVLADKQMRNYYALVSVEEEIGVEAFAPSRASTFSFNKNTIGKAITYATATRLHLSVHGTAPPALCQAGQPMTSAECLKHGAAYASQHTSPHPTAIVGGGAHSVVPSAPISLAMKVVTIAPVPQVTSTHCLTIMTVTSPLFSPLIMLHLVAAATTKF